MMKLRFLPIRRSMVILDSTRSVVIQSRANTSLAAEEHATNKVRPYEEIPGPKPFDAIKNVWSMLPIILGFKSLDAVQSTLLLRQTYGDIVKFSKQMTFRDMVYIFNPNDIETLFRNEGPWPIRPASKLILHYRETLRKDLFKGVLGLASTQGKEWQDFRTKVNQTMMQPRNTKMYVGPIDEVTSDLIERMRSLTNEKGELPNDFIKHLNRWSLESICVIALDTRMGCLDPDLKADSEPQKMIDSVNVVFSGMLRLEFMPHFIHFTKRKLWKDFVKALDMINEVSLKYIEKAKQKIQNKVEAGQKEMSILETLLIKNEDPMIAMVMALDMLQGGIDTTSHSTAIALHYLARNQDKQEKVFQELKNILPNKEQKITAQNLDYMKYLKACIKESMRMSPITLGNGRELSKDVVFSNYLVPKGTFVFTPNLVLCRDEKYFPQADVFLPERWLKGNELQQKPNPFVLLPFGFGPRMCIARRFAELEIETLVAKVIRNFRIEYDQELKFKFTVLNSVASPLNFKLEDRRD